MVSGEGEVEKVFWLIKFLPFLSLGETPRIHFSDEYFETEWKSNFVPARPKEFCIDWLKLSQELFVSKILTNS